MSLTAAQVVAHFERRYDYQSARTILRAVATEAGIGADGPFDGPQLGKLASALEAMNDRADAVVSALREAASGGKAQPKASPAPKDAKPEPKPEPAKAAEADPKPADAKADAKPADSKSSPAKATPKASAKKS